MKLKRTTSILRRLLIIVGVIFSLATFCACANNESSSDRTIAGVFASDVIIVYDGMPHSITVTNTLTTDSVLYSTDGKNYSETQPTYTLPGDYTIYFKVNRSGYKEFSSSAVVSISPCVLNDVSAQNISVTYDGQPHTVTIDGLLPSDFVLYSTDGLSFSSKIPSFTKIGEYTIYYSVERDYGYYKSSCTLTILSAVYGRYFNQAYGVVELSPYTATFDSADYIGFIGDEPFSVADGVLTYKELTFELLSDEDYVYRLIVSDNNVYFCADSSGKLAVSFVDGAAVIKLGDDTLLSVPNYNYCESGNITDYIELCFEQAFGYSNDITEVRVDLSNRDINPISFGCQYVTYDGKPHGFEFAESVKYISEQTMFTDVGRHTVSVVVVSEEFLPCVVDCTMVILPDLTGVYATSEHVIQISDETIEFDGVDCGELSVIGDDWAWNGLPITVANDGIVYDGVTYTATTDIILVVQPDDEQYALLRLPQKTDQLDLSYNGTALTFAIDDEVLLSIPLNCDYVTVLLQDAELPSINQNGTNTFIIGRGDLSSNVVIINIKRIVSN
ncbi:MAG: hypothetical protein K2M47_00265 [Clostridiales bacterium]|nr:hypothetical protein [Clostridiales bacterium]